MAESKHYSVCRSCAAGCPVTVSMDDGSVTNTTGVPGADVYDGFYCPKGRGLTAAHNDPDRLRHHLKRAPDGTYHRIGTDELVDDIATTVERLLNERGPRSIAGSFGNSILENPLSAYILPSFLGAIGSDRYYSNVTIDQPGIPMAYAMHGNWAGGYMRANDCDAFLMIGANPVISKQYVPQNPAMSLTKMVRSGCKLIVMDPRKSETARKATVHLPVIPGEDASVLAGLIHLIIRNGHVNREFIGEHTEGFDTLRAHVERFTPEYVADRAGINVEDLHKAAQILGTTEKGDCASGVGASMSTRATLNAYLMNCLKSVRGFYPMAGADASHPRVLCEPRTFKAQPSPTRPAWGFGRTSPVRGLQDSVCGPPLSALPEEMLRSGPDQVKAYFTLGSGITNFPETNLIQRAFESLDLLVIHDVERSAMSRGPATHVIATKKQFEIPWSTQFMEAASNNHPGYGWDDPYAAYYPALFDPPEGFEVLDSWVIYYRIAQKLGLTLQVGGILSLSPITELDMTNEPTNEDLWKIFISGGAVPFAELQRQPYGKIYHELKTTVQPKDPECQDRLNLGHDYIMDELAEVRSESIEERRGVTDEYPFQYICARMRNTSSASHRPRGVPKSTVNPMSIHPDDAKTLGIEAGDLVEMRSRHGSIIGVAAIDKYMRRGVVSMCYGFGKMPGEQSSPRVDGANVNNLISWDDDYDPIHGMPRMSALPVRLTKAVDRWPHEQSRR